MFLNSSRKNCVNHNCTPTHNCKVVSLKVPFEYIYLMFCNILRIKIYTQKHVFSSALFTPILILNWIFQHRYILLKKGFHWIHNTLSPSSKFAYRITRIILFSFPPFNQFPTYKPLYLSFLQLFILDINIYGWPLSLKCISFQYAFLDFRTIFLWQYGGQTKDLITASLLPFKFWISHGAITWKLR